MWEALRGRARRPRRDRLDVLDIGGGTGGFAVRVAELGHRVTVVDPSPDALAALDRRAAGEPASPTGSAAPGRPGQPARRWSGAGSADVVLCHGVLEVVDDPAAALATIAEVLRPGGTLSLLVTQRHAAVVARAMAGHLGQARELLDAGRPRGGRRRAAGSPPRRSAALLADAGFDDADAARASGSSPTWSPARWSTSSPAPPTRCSSSSRRSPTRPEYLAARHPVHVARHPR